MLAARYEEDHKHDRRRQRRMRDTMQTGSGVGASTVAQQALLPDTSDASIWRVKCQTGREFQLVRSILLRHIDQMNRGEPQTTLKSAFHSNAKGYIYIEAFSEVCAKKAVGGLRGLYQTSFTKVSIPEMTAVISVQAKSKPLQEGQWVRLRRGPLKGDLAKIVELMDAGMFISECILASSCISLSSSCVYHSHTLFPVPQSHQLSSYLSNPCMCRRQSIRNGRASPRLHTGE